MKTRTFRLLALLCSTGLFTNAQVGIGTNNPAQSAQLEVKSDSRGFLPPRLTYEQRNLIQSPVAGLMIWCSNCDVSGEIQVYNGSKWTNMIGGTSHDPGVKIGSQVWMPKNLDVAKYRNGDLIPQVKNDDEWKSLTTGAWCYYKNDSAYFGPKYGKMYNWYAVNDPRGLAPEGWHVPSDSEWNALSNFLGGDSISGKKLKEQGTAHWQNDSSGTNSSGFTGLPGGHRYVTDFLGEPSIFMWDGAIGFWWSTSLFDDTKANIRVLVQLNDSFGKAETPKKDGVSIRCVRD
ncbi:MAG: fibrobacter succinogenes major paralogous domain-containing protein [Ferruginibacter sp.]